MLESLSPAELLRRSGALTMWPQAMARMNGAMTLARLTLERAPVPVAPTPATIVAAEGAARLLRYEPMPGVAPRDPIVLCPSLINRLYVLDLKEGLSVVEVLRKSGHRVYGIDWGDPGPAEHGVTFEGFVARLGRLLDAACVDARTEKAHLLGHCLGGTMATALAATDDRRIQSLVNLTAPLSFDDSGLLSKWTRAPFFDPQLVADTLGHVPPWLTQPAFQILKPMGQPTKALRLFQALEKPPQELQQFLDVFRCLETWINDNVSIPDRFFVDLVGTLYREDALARGTLQFARGPVSLDAVTVPVFTIAASEDHIVPPASATGPARRFKNPANKTDVLPGGHIGVVVGGLGRKRLWPALLAWLDEHGAAPLPEAGDGKAARRGIA